MKFARPLLKLCKGLEMIFAAVISIVTVHVVRGLFPLMRFALEMNVSPSLSVRG